MTMALLFSMSPNTSAMTTTHIVPGNGSYVISDIPEKIKRKIVSPLIWWDVGDNVYSADSTCAACQRPSVDTWSLSDALDSIERIRMLKDNWDNEGSRAFTSQLLDRVSEIVKQLDPAPYIAPTGLDSILLEYYGKDDEYLSFDISVDDSVQMVRNDAKEEYVTRAIPSSDIRNVVNEFYERTSV